MPWMPAAPTSARPWRPGLRLGRCRRPLDRHRPRPSRRTFRRGPDLAMIRVLLPYAACERWPASRTKSCLSYVPGAGHVVLCPRRAGGPAIRCSAGRFATRSLGQRRAFLRFFACRRDLSHEPPMRRCPKRLLAGPRHVRLSGRLRAGNATMKIYTAKRLPMSHSTQTRSVSEVRT